MLIGAFFAPVIRSRMMQMAVIFSVVFMVLLIKGHLSAMAGVSL